MHSSNEGGIIRSANAELPEATMSGIANHLQRVKREKSLTVRAMAQMAGVDQSQMCLWLNGAPISSANMRKLLKAEFLTFEEAAIGLLGTGDAA